MMGQASELHRNWENMSRISALASLPDTLGDADKTPILIQSCRIGSVLSAIFLELMALSELLSYYASKSNTRTGRMPIPQEAQKN